MKRIFKLQTMSTEGYIRLLNGIFNLTNKEIQVLGAFIDMQQSHPEMNVFSAEFKKKIAEQLGMKHFTVLNVYLQALMNKKAVFKGESYKINPALIRQENQTAIELRWE